MTENCSDINDEKEDRALIRDGWQCQYCGRVGAEKYPEEAPEYQDEPVELHVHHKVPLSKGGSDELSNRITICAADHRRHHNDPAPQGPDTGDVGSRAVGQSRGFPDPESTEAEMFVRIAHQGPVRTGELADAIGKSAEHTRRLLYRLGSRDLVLPTGDGGWDIRERVPDPPIGEFPESAPLAAIRTRDELLRRAAEWGLDDGDLAEIADVSPRTARIAIDRAATYQVPLPEDTTRYRFRSW